MTQTRLMGLKTYGQTHRGCGCRLLGDSEVVERAGNECGRRVAIRCRAAAVTTWLLALVAAGSSGALSPEANPNALSAPPPSVSALDAALDDLAGQMLGSLQLQNRTTVAVAEFPDLNGTVTQFGQFVAEELITRLHRSGKFRVIERRQLNKVIAEHQLDASGLVDGGTARQLGMILGVDAIASGTITDLGEVLKLNARLIAAESGRIFAVAAVEIVRDRAVAGLLDRADSSQPGAPAGAPTRGESRSTAAPPAEDYAEGRRAIDRLVAACGGAAALSAIDSYRSTVVHEVELSGADLKLTIDSTVLYPDQVYTRQDAPSVSVTRVMSGSQGWIDEPTGTRDLNAEELAQIRRELRADLVAILRRPALYTFSARAPEKVADKPCLPVHVRHVDDDCGTIYLDRQTDLPVMMEQVVPSPLTGRPSTAHWYFDEFKAFGEVTLPSRGRMYYDEVAFSETRLSAFVVNPRIDHELFERK